MRENEIKLMWFHKMICCCHDFHLWIYDEDLNLLQSSCPDNEPLKQWFLLCFQQAEATKSIFKSSSPMIVTGAINMMWIVIPEINEKETSQIHALGPFFVDNTIPYNLDLSLLQKGVSRMLRRQVLDILKTLPVISWNLMLDYAIMMNYCITESQVSPSDFRYFSHMEESSLSHDKLNIENYSVHGTYQAEQTMLQMVRDGNLELLSYLDTMATTGQLGKLSNGDFLRQMKNTVEVSITLFSRAAIEGGISPELSYNLADQYFQAVESCNNLGELTPIASTMHRDYVERVHKCKMQQYSKPIIGCCDYIMLHLEEDISIADIAKHTGYSDYYCSKKFKKETGMTPAEYIRLKRLEAAANLLITSNDEIQEIAARFHFGSQSYFTDSFRKTYGVSPRKYRAAAHRQTQSH